MVQRGEAMILERMIIADYDADEDVLYVHSGTPRPSYCDETDEGLLLRFSNENDAPSGVTVIGYAQVWSNRRRDLYGRIGDFLRAPTLDVERAVEQAVERERHFADAD